jgi:hypothetical protein
MELVHQQIRFKLFSDVLHRFKSGPCIKMLKALYRESTRMVNVLCARWSLQRKRGDSVQRDTHSEFSYRAVILITTIIYIKLTNCWHKIF